MPNLTAVGFPNPDPDAPNISQGLITALATRALIFIQADNLNIGLMCFIAVGDGRGIDVPDHRQKRRGCSTLEGPPIASSSIWRRRLRSVRSIMLIRMFCLTKQLRPSSESGSGSGEWVKSHRKFG